MQLTGKREKTANAEALRQKDSWQHLKYSKDVQTMSFKMIWRPKVGIKEEAKKINTVISPGGMTS